MKRVCIECGKGAGFTLVELMVVVVVLVALALLGVPMVRRLGETGRSTACLGHLRQLGIGLNGYLGDHGQVMPVLRGARASRSDEEPVVDVVLGPYVGDERVFACPADPRLAAASGTSYFWNVALNGQPLADLNFLRLSFERGKIPLLSDKEAFHPYSENKVNILYADGHATKELQILTGR
jgi:prepilin-type N-terminal cleavage/methylation domain-containing protein/prepilin-type processing-associated H-X9-DG protein